MKDAKQQSQRVASLADTLTPDVPASEVAGLVRKWIDDNVPGAWVAAARTEDMAELHRVRTPEAYRDWYPALGLSGLVAPNWPVAYGGLGLAGPATQAVLDELGRHRLARLNILGVTLAGPTLLGHGTPAQKARYLPPILTNAEPWCQLFSEPGAGSDLAGLSTRAVANGDGTWTVTGQKVWTSFSREARWGLLLARTDPDVPKHAGLTVYVCDMSSSAVDVRPLRKITGESEFSEVFIEQLVISGDDQLGSLGDGWRIAQTVLRHERQSLGGSGSGGRSRSSGSSVERVADLARQTLRDGQPLLDDSLFRDRLAASWIESMTVRWTNQRAAQLRRQGLPAVHPSVQKLLQSKHNQRLQLLALEATGGSFAAYADDQRAVGESIHGFLRSRGDTIAGGTSEIQSNIVGERSLGLPRDPSDDHSIPWRDIPRGPAQR